MSLADLYRRYLRAADHPAKLRVVRLIERWLSANGLLVVTQPLGQPSIPHVEEPPGMIPAVSAGASAATRQDSEQEQG